MKERAFNSPSLDQITPGGGYKRRNVQVVVWWYNAAKQRFTDREVLALCELVCETAKAPFCTTSRVQHVEAPMPMPAILTDTNGVIGVETT